MSTYLNMLPQSYHRQWLLRRRLWQWASLWGLFLLIATALFWVRYQEHQVLTTRLRVLENDYAPIKQLQDRLISCRKELADVQHRETLALRLSDRRSMLTLLGLVTRAAHSCEGQVSIHQFVLGAKKRGIRNCAGESMRRTLTLEGLGVNNLSIARFAAALRMSNAFCQVQLKSTAQKRIGSVSARSYSLECTFD